MQENDVVLGGESGEIVFFVFLNEKVKKAVEGNGTLLGKERVEAESLEGRRELLAEDGFGAWHSGSPCHVFLQYSRFFSFWKEVTAFFFIK